MYACTQATQKTADCCSLLAAAVCASEAAAGLRLAFSTPGGVLQRNLQELQVCLLPGGGVARLKNDGIIKTRITLARTHSRYFFALRTNLVSLASRSACETHHLPAQAIHKTTLLTSHEHSTAYILTQDGPAHARPSAKGPLSLVLTRGMMNYIQTNAAKKRPARLKHHHRRNAAIN